MQIHIHAFHHSCFWPSLNHAPSGEHVCMNSCLFCHLTCYGGAVLILIGREAQCKWVLNLLLEWVQPFLPVEDTGSGIAMKHNHREGRGKERGLWVSQYGSNQSLARKRTVLKGGRRYRDCNALGQEWSTSDWGLHCGLGQSNMIWALQCFNPGILSP